MSEVYFDYDLDKYDFVSLFQTLFKSKDLQKIHLNKKKNYNFFANPGKDSDTEFHKIFLDLDLVCMA